MSQQKMPDVLYVKIDDRDEDCYLADTELANLISTGEEAKIGVYALVEVKTAKGVVETD